MFSINGVIKTSIVSASLLIASDIFGSAEVDFEKGEVTIGTESIEEIIVIGIRQNPRIPDDLLFLFRDFVSAGSQQGWERDITAMDEFENKVDGMIENCLDLQRAKAQMPYCTTRKGTNSQWLASSGREIIQNALFQNTHVTSLFYKRIVMPAARRALPAFAGSMDFNVYAQALFNAGTTECRDHWHEVGPRFFNYDVVDCQNQLASFVTSLAPDPGQLGFTGFSFGPISFDLSGLSEDFSTSLTQHVGCRAWYKAWDRGQCESLSEGGLL